MKRRRKKIKSLLSKVNKVNITIDMWTSCQDSSYMVVTCHFINATWSLNRSVLNFCSFPPPHTGHAISQTLLKYFRDSGIENKVYSVTVDNVTNNDLAIKNLREVFNKRKLLPLDGKLFHGRCCAHVTNLMVQYGLFKIKPIVDCVRDDIKYLVASELRLLKFTEHATNLQLSKKKTVFGCVYPLE